MCDSRDSCRLQMVLMSVLSKGLKMLDVCLCLDRMSMMIRVRGQFISVMICIILCDKP